MNYVTTKLYKYLFQYQLNNLLNLSLGHKMLINIIHLSLYSIFIIYKALHLKILRKISYLNDQIITKRLSDAKI